MNENIFLCMNENENENENENKELLEESVDLTEILNQLKEPNEIQKQDDGSMYDIHQEYYINSYDYDLNYTVKQISTICEYYNCLPKRKMNKNEMIHLLVMFENNPENSEIVFKRKRMWFYMNELKNDKCMKKYVLWNS